MKSWIAKTLIGGLILLMVAVFIRLQPSQKSTTLAPARPPESPRRPPQQAPKTIDARLDGPLENSSVPDAESIYGDLDGDGMDEIVVQFKGSPSLPFRFVVLKSSNDKPSSSWRTVASLDIEAWHLSPEARIVSSGPHQWLAIDGFEDAWGTEAFQQSEKWYALSNGTLAEVWAHPSKGIRSLGGPNLESYFFDVELKIASLTNDGAADKVAVDAEIASGTALSATRRLVFFRPADSQQFVFDESESEISATDYARFSEASATDLVRFASTEVRDLAKAEKGRSWLRGLLPHLDDPEKKDIEKLIASRR